MTKLACPDPMDPSRLRGGRYVESLLEEAQRVGLLTQPELLNIRSGLALLLADRVRRYTGGESTSLRAEAAQSLLDSALLTLGLALKDLPSPAAAVAALKSSPLPDLYAQGRKRLTVKLRVARQLWRAVAETLPPIGPDVMRETLLNGVAGFFRRYDPDYAAQELHITCDYPLCCPVEELQGVEFMVEYLDRAKWENRFCARFAPDRPTALLRRTMGDYSVQIFNLFGQVYTAALGCILMGADPATLTFSPSQVRALEAAWLVKSRAEIEALCLQANRRLVPPGPEARYLDRAAAWMSGALCHSAQELTLDRIFVPERIGANR